MRSITRWSTKRGPQAFKLLLLDTRVATTDQDGQHEEREDQSYGLQDNNDALITSVL